MDANHKQLIGARIRKLREEAELTQEEFGTLFDVKFNTVSQWESGKNSPPHATLVRMSEKFQVPLAWLMGQDREISAQTLKERWPLLSPEHREKAAKLAEMPGASIPSDATDDIIDILWAAVQTAITVTGAVTKRAAPKGGSLQEDD